MSLFASLKKRLYFVAASYFRFFANISLRRWHPRIFVITGSAGKTTMLHLLEHELGDKAHYSHGANSAFGIPFDILNLSGVISSRKSHWFALFLSAPFKAFTAKHSEKYYVAEIDCERPHEASFLAEWLQPEVTFWVSFGLSHAAQFESAKPADQDLETFIAEEFAALPRATKKRIYIDGDSPIMAATLKGIKTKVISFRKREIRGYTVRPDSTDFVSRDHTFHFAAPEPHELAVQLLMLRDFIQKYLHLKPSSDFTDLSLPPGRSSYFKGIKNTNIVDSSYNAHIVSMIPVLEMARLARLMQAQHKWLIIGDIVDQGSIEGEEHKKLAGLIADVEADQIILIGRRTKKYTAPKLKELGVSAITTTDPKKALKYIETHLKGGETLIFKGSQYLEWIIEKLLADPKDADKLCRRDAGARKRREAWGLK